MINRNNIKIINDIKGYISTGKNIKTIIENTVNTWQENRTEQSKKDDTELGKLAEDIFTSYIKQNLQQIAYLSYDDIRTNNFKKHAPFDGLLFNNNININTLKELIDEINTEVTNDKWGKISDKLKLKCYQNHVYITEIKSTRIAKRHKDSSDNIDLDVLLKDDFLEYPKYLRKDTYNTIHSYTEYIDFCKKYRGFVCKSGDCLLDIKKEEMLNMKHLYIRVYIDEYASNGYLIGCISHKTFIEKSEIKKMPQRNKSELALYLATSLINGVDVGMIAKIK